MKWKVEVECQPDLVDPIGLGIKSDIEDLGIDKDKVEKVRTSQIYLIEGDIPESQIEEVGAKLLTDALTQFFSYQLEGEGRRAKGEGYEGFVVEVRYKPGVTDAVGDSVKKGTKDLGFEGVKSVSTAQKYQLFGKLNTSEVELICKRLLANEVIQECEVRSAKCEV